MMKQQLAFVFLLLSSLMSAQSTAHSGKFALADGWHLQVIRKSGENGRADFRVRALRPTGGTQFQSQPPWLQHW